MLQLLLFDTARALRPGRSTLIHGHLCGLERVPACTRADLGLAGDMCLGRAAERADRQVDERRRGESARLLGILSEIARQRGFGPVAWEIDDA